LNLGSLPVIPTGATGFVTLIVAMILRGKLVLKSAADQRMVELENRLLEVKQDRDMWKATYHSEVRTNVQLVGQLNSLMEVGRTTDHVMRSLSTSSELVGGGDDQVSSTPISP
jgi:hypothetical protein